jgi:hypothetical protein
VSRPIETTRYSCVDRAESVFAACAWREQPRSLCPARVLHSDAGMRAILVVVIIGAVSWGTWSTLAVDERPARPPASPVEALQQDILHAGIDLPGDPALGAIYQALNARHFAAALPAMPVRWEPRLRDVTSLAAPSFTLEGMFGSVGTKMTILLHPTLKTDRAALDRTLSHEMVHAYLAVSGDTGTQHGPAFQTVLERLAAEGAFEGVVATDEERRRLRAWLDAESARLVADRDAMTRRGRELDQERAGLEQALAAAGPLDQARADALNARREAYNSNAMRANDEAGRHQQALAWLNREIERYNLMVKYPDGLDEAAMFRPTSP